MGGERRFYRLLTLDDIPELEAASAFLFAFDPTDLRLGDIIQDDRWFCLAAVSSPRPGVEQIVGFVAAAVGRVGEFTQEAPFLTQTLLASQAGSSSNAHPPAEAGTLAAVGVTAAPEHLDTAAAGGSDDSSDGSSSRTAAAAATAADALAVEVVLLGVVSGYRRQGVASRLLQQVKRHARSTGACLVFLHVQDTNTPARRLYSKEGFSQVATLDAYYSRQLTGMTGSQQQQHQGAAGSSSSSSGFWASRGSGALAMPMQQAEAHLDAAPAAGTSAAAPAAAAGPFTGVDAQLLVLLLKQSVLQGVEPDADTTADLGSSSSSSSKSSRSVSESGTADMSDWPPLRLPSNMRSSSTSAGVSTSSSRTTSSSSSRGSESPASPTPTPRDAAEAAAEAAAAAASAVLGGALRLLTGGMFGRPGGAGSSRGARVGSGRLGKVVDLGGEVMVEVREGRDVVLVDPDELPPDVVLSGSDKERLRQRRQWQALMQGAAAAQQQQQQQQQSQTAASSSGSDGRGDDDSSSSSGGGGGGGSSGSLVSSVRAAGPGSSNSSSSSVCSGDSYGSCSSSSCGHRHSQLPAAHLLQHWQEAAESLQHRQCLVPHIQAHLLQQWEGRQQRQQRAVCDRAIRRAPAVTSHLVKHKTCVGAAPPRLL